MSSSGSKAVRVLHVRVKDQHAQWLCGLAREVNTVFNYCNELSVKVFERERRFLSGFDFRPLLKGVTRDDCYFAGRWLSLWDSSPIEAERFYRDLEPTLAQAQRGRHRKRIQAIHAKIAHRRKDFLRKLNAGLVKANGAMFVGSVNASALAKTRQAKQRTVCGAIHDRDVNAAHNILAAGHRRLAEGILGP